MTDPEVRKRRRLQRKLRKQQEQEGLERPKAPVRQATTDEPIPKAIASMAEALIDVLQKDKSGVSFYRLAWSQSGTHQRIERNRKAETGD